MMRTVFTGLILAIGLLSPMARTNADDDDRWGRRSWRGEQGNDDDQGWRRTAPWYYGYGNRRFFGAPEPIYGPRPQFYPYAPPPPPPYNYPAPLPAYSAPTPAYNAPPPAYNTPPANYNFAPPYPPSGADAGANIGAQIGNALGGPQGAAIGAGIGRDIGIEVDRRTPPTTVNPNPR